MTTFGRKPITKVAIPNNRLLAKRANRLLEGYAQARAEHFQNSLGVDAPLFYFWHKENGSIPCSCLASRTSANRDVTVGGENQTQIVRDQKKDFNISIPEYGESTVRDTFGLSDFNERQPNSRDKFNVNDYDDPLAGHDDTINDLDDITDGDGITDFQDPLNIFADKITYCPVCFGSGFIDSWNIHGGKRYVFDTSNVYYFKCDGVDVKSEENPTKLVSEKVNAACYWRFTLPLVWNKILRINVYNGNLVVAPHLYTWTYKDASNNIKEISVDNLEELNGSGETVSLQIQFKETVVQMTHAEIIFSFQDPYYAQVPEIQQGYEQEFLDWNVNITVELPPDLDISEGDYLTESKYQKVWKVSALTKRVTAGGVVFGLIAELRALHSFESNLSNMAIFSTQYFNGVNPLRG